MNTSSEVFDNDVNIYQEDNSSNFINRVILPFYDNPAGYDPRYTDSFIAIKSEVDKLYDIDFDLIKDLSESILINESKDLRVCGYYVFALTYLQGITGLIMGLEVYSKILNEYFSVCFPEKNSAKISAIKWLNNKKIISFVRNFPSDINIDSVNKLESVIIDYNAIASIKTNDPELSVTAFRDFFIEYQSLISRDVHNPSIHEAISNNDEFIDSSCKVISVNENSDSSPDQSESVVDEGFDVIYHTRKICSFLLQEKDYVKEVKYSRACGWASCKIPSHTLFQTQIQAPREIKLNEIKKRFLACEFDFVINLSEKIFFEEGGNYLLTLQKYTYDSAVALGNTELADEITFQVKTFVRRVGNDILNLKFSNKLSFAEQDTIQWIKLIVLKNDDALPKESNLDKAIRNARQILVTDTLSASLDALDDCVCLSEKERIIIQFEKAKLCVQSDENTIATYILNDLYSIICDKYLYLWDVGLAVDISFLYKNILTVECEEKGEVDELRMSNSITRNIYHWDFNRAVKLFE